VADPVIEERHGQRLIDALSRSRDRLKVEQIYGLLVHRVSDLGKPGAEHLVEALLETRSRGLVKRIGVSVYDADELLVAERRFRPELVQLPLNVLDQRPIASGLLARLKALGVEIHARSVFLQGLLLMKPSNLPDFFKEVRDPIAALRNRWTRSGLRPLAGCLAFVLHRPEIDAVIVGVNRRSELEEIGAAIAAIVDREVEVGVVPPIDPIYLNPSRWPARSHQVR
jgi:aryl-alcohol dehydrogenase-like predicted oxidoreductase